MSTHRGNAIVCQSRLHVWTLYAPIWAFYIYLPGVKLERPLLTRRVKARQYYALEEVYSESRRGLSALNCLFLQQ